MSALSIGVEVVRLVKFWKAVIFQHDRDQNFHLLSLLLWQVDSLPLSHMGSPRLSASWDANSQLPILKHLLI